MANTTTQYGNESIQLLKDEQRVRQKPAVIFGSDGLEGCEHAAFEILSNAIDEAREGHGSLVTLTYFEDKSIEVEDFGRGCPLDWNPNEKRWNWELVFCELYAGGKYKNSEGGDYDYSLGTNGLGSCATQYASEYMDVTVWRDEKKYSLHFKKGKVCGKKGKELTVEPADRKKTGTTIRWRPDLEVFTDIDIPVEYFEEMLHKQAVVNAGVTFRLRVQKGSRFETKEYLYANGIEDYVKEFAGENPLTLPVMISAERKGRDRDDLPDYKVKISACFCFSKDTQIQEYYHNSSWLENGGSPEKAARSAFTSAIDNYIKQQSKYTKNESSVKWQDIQDCLILVTNCFSTQTSYENQTKKAINNRFIQQAMTEFFKAQLEVYFIENKPEADRIADQVLVNKRSREHAEKARQNIKNNLQQKIDMANRVQKFIDCRSKDTGRREVYIVEGDSAAGACRQSRDAEFQGVMPVRGKILNCLKADYVRIFKSEIITDLLKVLGCGVEVKDKHSKDLSTFDLNNLRWNKVIICTDADVDGFQIRTLILTMLYRLVPTLTYSDREKAEILESLNGAKCTINRSKGLGENDPDMMWMTTMNPETRRLIKVLPEDAEKMAEVFELLLGDNLEGRKQHIATCGAQYLDMLDVS